MYTASAWTKTGMPYYIFENQVSHLWATLGSFTHPVHRDNIAWLRASGVNSAPLDAMYQRLNTDYVLIARIGWRLGEQLSDRLDTFLKIQSKQDAARKREPELMPEIVSEPESTLVLPKEPRK